METMKSTWRHVSFYCISHKGDWRIYSFGVKLQHEMMPNYISIYGVELAGFLSTKLTHCIAVVKPLRLHQWSDHGKKRETKLYALRSSCCSWATLYTWISYCTLGRSSFALHWLSDIGQHIMHLHGTVNKDYCIVFYRYVLCCIILYYSVLLFALQITQLKIDHNPFAKGFRDTGSGKREKKWVDFFVVHNSLRPRQICIRYF